MCSKKKIRIRNYPELNNEEYFFEIKISSIEGRFKKTKKINKDFFYKYLKNGFFDNYYGTCRPKVTVSYLREYYTIWGMRLTIDKNINYQNYSSKIFKAFDTEVIVELKSGNIFEKEKFKTNFQIKKLDFQSIADLLNFLIKQILKSITTISFC